MTYKREIIISMSACVHAFRIALASAVCAGVCFLTPAALGYQEFNSDSATTTEVGPKVNPVVGVPQARINKALERAGENRKAIEAFLHSYQEGTEERQAADFLIANMPTVDLVSMTTGELRENVEYAFKARRELPWVHDLPFSLFVHYVLPHRVTQESYEPWRKELFETIAPILKGCKNMTEAAIAVNRWCGQRVTFKQTEFRDQNVMSTLRSGIGRCEEEMIVTIDAMRSVGIPARACSAPWWVVNDNNHAWVEVWTDGNWHYIGGCEPTPKLDHAWFSGPAQRAGTVISQSFGSPDEFPTGEVICRDMDNMALINSTSVYAMTGEVEVVVVDGDGKVVSDCPVSVAVFNYGGLRPLNIQRTGSEGRTTFVMGLGDYFFAAGVDGKGRAHEVIKTKPGERVVRKFALREGDEPDDVFWMRYPTTAEARRLAAKRIGRSEVRESAVSFTPDLPKPTALDIYAEGKDEDLESIIEGSKDADGWRSILNEARANWRSIAEGLKELSGDEAFLDDAFAFMSRTTKLDRLEITPATIVDHVRVASVYRDKFTNKKLYEDDVLNGRIGYEHMTPWRSRVVDVLGTSCFDDDDLQTAESINLWIKDHVTDEEKSRLGPTMNPGQVLRARRGNHREKVGFAVGVLRAFGVPAKTSDTGGRVEFYDGSVWREFDPGDISSMKLIGSSDVGGNGSGEVEGNEKAGDVVLPAKVRVQLMRDGKPLGGSFHGLDIAKFHNGSWAPLRDYGYESNDDGAHVITVPAGEYLVTAGVRNANGDPYIHTKLVNLKSGDDIAISWVLDLPADSGVFRFPHDRKIESLPERVMVKNVSDGSMIDLSALVKESPVLLYFFRMDDEPSIRMIAKVNDSVVALEKVGVKVVGISLPAATDSLLSSFLSRHPADFMVVEGSVEVGEAFGLEMTQPLGLFRPMPSVLLMQRGGGVVMWVEGLNLDLDRLLTDASRQIN